jgi:hypothetical protein
MCKKINIRIIFKLLLLLGFNLYATAHTANFDKASFYSAMASGDMNTINTQLNIIKSSSIYEKDAYEGALLMKKAGLVVKAKEKLSLFKAGRIKLETAIKNSKNNTEFYFLRLIIQEHAPRLVEYRSNIESDAASIRSNFKSLSPVIQQAINDYSKKSKVLKPL